MTVPVSGLAYVCSLTHLCLVNARLYSKHYSCSLLFSFSENIFLLGSAPFFFSAAAQCPFARGACIGLVGPFQVSV